MREKFCPNCEDGKGKMKSELHFAGDRTQADGLCRICRECYGEYQKRRRLVMKFAGETKARLHSYIPPNSF